MKGLKPRASIIMPCWNSGDYIEESVASALAQTGVPLELVVADDGSDDAQTVHELSTLERCGDPRIRVIHLPHRGLPATRNAAIRAARGRYILPLDSDDLIEPQYLAEAVSILAVDPGVGMVYAKADYFGGRTGPWELPPFSMEEILCNNMIYASAVFRKEDFLRIGGYDASLPFYEDWDFWLSMLELGRRPVRLEGTYFHYRKRADSTSMTQQGYPVATWLEVLDRMVEKHIGLYQAHVRAFANRMRLLDAWKDARIRSLRQELARAKAAGGPDRTGRA